MANGAPDLSDLLSVIDEPIVVPPLHQISSGQSENMQIGTTGLFSPPNLSFPTELNTQPQLGQIPELEHDLPESAFLPTDVVQGHSFKDSAFQVGNEDGGSLGSLFLTSIGHQLDSGKIENAQFAPTIPHQDTPNIVLSKPRHQNNPSQQIRNSSHAMQRNSAKSNYPQFDSNMPLSSATDVGASGISLNSSSTGLQSLPFIVPTDMQPAIANIHTGASQKKTSSGQFAFPHHGARQPSLPTNPPRPLSATSSSSEHVSRPGSVQQPSPSCGSNHSGDPATPLTPQSYNAGTPQPYKPATPGNPSAIQQQRRPGFVDIHHSPQISQVSTNQQSVIGYQQPSSTTQPITASNEGLKDLPTPIKNVFDPVGSVATFQNDDIDDNNLWNAGSALMAPSALFVSTAASQLQSNPVLVTQNQNFGFGISGDMYGVNLPMYTNRIPPRNELNFEESLTPKQNEILNQLSAKGLKKSNVSSVQLISGSVVNESAAAPGINATTMEMMNKANTAGTTAVEKLLGSTQYEAISPVSDYSMSPASKPALPEELTDNLYLPSKFSSEIEMPSSEQDQQSSLNHDLTDPVMMYTTQKEDTQISQRNIPDLLGPESVPELIGFPANDWSAPVSSLPSSQMHSSLTMTSQSSSLDVTVSQHGLMSSNQWIFNNVVPSDYGASGSVAHQSSHENIGPSDFGPAPNVKVTESSLKDTEILSTQKQLPPQTFSVNAKEARSFGMPRYKPSLDKAKVGVKSSKASGQSESAFGFESDDETETIRLMPPSAPSKKPPKQTQPNFPPVKPRTMLAVGPSDDLRQKMETVKQLQQQQIRLQQIQAYQSQNASTSSITNPNYGRHFQFQNKAHLLPTGSHQSHHDTVRNKNVVETTTVASVSHLPQSTSSYSSLFSSFTSANLPTSGKTLNTSVPMSLPQHVPLSLAQPAPSYGDSSRFKPLQNPLQTDSQYSTKPRNVRAIPSFLDSIQKPTTNQLLVGKTSANMTSVKVHEKPQVAVSSASYTNNSTPVVTLSSQVSQFPPSWKPFTASSSIGLISTSTAQQTSKTSINSALQPTPLLSTPSQSSEHPNLNLDWLHRESERVASEKSSSSKLDFLNTITSPSASIPPSSYAARTDPPHSSSSVHSSLSSNTTSLLSEDYLVPLKQSIQHVDRVGTPKTQPPITTTFTPTTKKHLPSEPRQINFKKHRILEGALPSTSVKSTPSISASSVFTTTYDTNVSTACSVLDKQRRYLKEHSNSKLKQRTPHVHDNTPTSSNVPAVSKDKIQETKQQLSESGKNNSFEKDTSKQGDKSGSMFMLFNSLLQEASESALKSRIESKETVAEKPVVKETTPKVSKSKPPPVSQSDTISPATKSGSVTAVSSAPTQMPSKPVTSVTTSSVTALTASQSTSEIKKPAKKNWSSAIPFKRRYFDDTQSQLSAASKAPVTVTTVPTVTSSSSEPIVSLPKITATTTVITSTKPVTSPVKLPAKIPAKIPPISSSTTAPVVSTLPTPATSSDKSVVAGGALKLRITAFRSSRGDIIHQSAMLDKGDNAKASDRGSHRKSKKKKKKDRKRKNDASSSDENCSVMTQPKADPREKLIEKAKLNEQITKELVELAKITSVKENDVTVSKSNPQKRKQARAGTADGDKKPPKRTRVTKSNVRKKQDSKVVEPVARYLPKSVLQASSGTSDISSTSNKTTVSIPATYQRAPGRLPLYLSSSDQKSSTAPTIQLVARSSTKVVSTTVESKSTQPTKVMNVKISKAISSRSFSTQLLPKSNVQYIIPTTRSQPRVILPDSSTSTSVSVVSPLIVRSFPSGLVPISTSTPNVTAITKPQLFTFPLTLNNSASHTLKNISAKISDKIKAQSEDGATTRSSCTLVHSSVAKKPAPSVTFLSNSKSITGLTGTLDTPRVTTKVVPSSVDQETNSNNFQSVLLKLITSPNPVTKYAPPEPPEAICMDLHENENFQCLACEDSFLFNDSLEDHYARRSILIKVRCMQCDQDLVFLNKCKLLMHARQHSDGMQFNNAYISPLPLHMCKPRSKVWFLDNMKANEEPAAQRKSSLANHEICSSITTVAEVPTALPASLVCTECSYVASSPEALEEHFQRTSPPPSPEKATDGNKAVANFMCDICSVSVPSRCSFLAHMRMHKRAKPHTCPECGKIFNDAGVQEQAHSESKREIDFNFHLSVECFHLCRMTAFKCRICNLICKNAELLRRHLEDRHLQTFYKCLDCPMAFKTQDNIASHQRSAHAVSPLTKMMYKCPKTIHKCPLCDTVFTDDNATQQLFLLQKHFEGHMSHPSINITAYKCLFCNDIFEKKVHVRDHIKTAHDVVAGSDGVLNNSKGLIDSKLKSNSSKKSRLIDSDDVGHSRKISRIVLAGDSSTCNTLIASGTLGYRESSKKKLSSDLVVKRKNAMQPLKLRLKGLSARVRDEMDADDLIDSPDTDVELTSIASVESVMRDGRRVFPCGQCTKELPSASARVNHIRLKHQGIRTLFCCPYCPSGKIKFAKKISMKKHLQKIHGMDQVTKDDVRVEYVKLPIGQRFDRTILNAEEGTVNLQQEQKSSSTGSKVRKKFTRPGRKSDRPARQVRQDLINPNFYLDNSDSEVERIMSNRVAEDASTDKTEMSDEDCDFSMLKFPTIYCCAKCDHRCEDRLEFQAHIVEHKEDAETEGITGMVQCTECGLCFASTSSHMNHLFIKHKIRKRKLLKKYDTQLKAKRKAEGSLPYQLSEEFLNNPNGASDSNVKKYKCSVCFKRFDEDAKLKTHMRTHGLAFVRSKHTS